jgi:hypothetical protein
MWLRKACGGRGEVTRCAQYGDGMSTSGTRTLSSSEPNRSLELSNDAIVYYRYSVNPGDRILRCRADDFE